MFFCGGGDVFQICFGDDAAGGITRRVDDNHLRFFVDEFIEDTQIEGEIILFDQRDGDWDAACHPDHRFVRGEARVRINNFVAGVDEGEGWEENVGFPSRADDDLLWRDIYSSPGRCVHSDSPPKGGRSGGRGVIGFSVRNCPHPR